MTQNVQLLKLKGARSATILEDMLEFVIHSNLSLLLCDKITFDLQRNGKSFIIDHITTTVPCNQNEKNTYYLH